MASVSDYLKANFVDPAAVTGFAYVKPASGGSLDPMTAEWAAIGKAVSTLVPGAVMANQTPSLKQQLQQFVLDGDAWVQIVSAYNGGDASAKSKLAPKVRAQGEKIEEAAAAIVPLIAKQMALNDQQSKSGPFNTATTIQPGSAATYNGPLADLRQKINTLAQKLSISLTLMA